MVEELHAESISLQMTGVGVFAGSHWKIMQHTGAFPFAGLD